MARRRAADVLEPPADPKQEAAAAVVASAAAKTEDRKTPKTKAERMTDGLAERQTAYSRISKTLEAKEKALTAAVMLMDGTQMQAAGFPTPNAVTRTWQHASWGYVHSVPELNAGKMYYGNCLSRCSLVVGKRNPDGSVEQGFTGEEAADELDTAIGDEAADLIHKLRTKVGGQSELMRSFGEKIFVAGELYLVPEDSPAGLVFEVLSTQELVPEGETFTRYYGPGWSTDPLPKTTKPLRVWRPDSQYGMLADSSVRSCLEILEELVVLTRLVRASAISRMALSGMLLIPDELDFPTDPAGPDTSETRSPLGVDIINTGSKAIDDPASAAAFMPYVLIGQSDLLDKVRHVPFQADDSENVIKRTEALQRLAQGLDLPVEVTLGHQSTTFANAAQVSIDTFNLHILPALELLCDALTVGYLWPAMAKNRGIDAEHLKTAPYPDEILQVAITYDARKLISKPDRTKELLDYAGKDLTFSAIRNAEIREALGLVPDTTPSDDEVAFRVNAYRLGRVREVIPGTPTEAATPVATAGNGTAPHVSDDPTSKSSTKEGITAAALRAKTNAKAAEKLNDESGGFAADPRDRLALQITGAVEFLAERAVERVGAKLRSKSTGREFGEAERSAIAGAENGLIPSILGREVVERLIGDEASRIGLAEVSVLTRQVKSWCETLGLPDSTDLAGRAAALARGVVDRALYEGTRLSVAPESIAESLFGVPAAV